MAAGRAAPEVLLVSERHHGSMRVALRLGSHALSNSLTSALGHDSRRNVKNPSAQQANAAPSFSRRRDPREGECRLENGTLQISRRWPGTAEVFA
jgi:hypothetical protein